MAKADFIYRQGEPIAISLLVVDGDISGVDDVEAVLKKTGPNGSVPPSTAPNVAVFTVQDAELPDVGWDLTLTEAETYLLPPGQYITNARINLLAGGPVKTGTVIIEIRGSVT